MGSSTDSFILLAGLGIIAYIILTKNPISQVLNEAINLPSQSITSPQRPELLGLRSTNKLGFDITTGLANLRDNLSFGGLFFQG